MTTSFRVLAGALPTLLIAMAPATSAAGTTRCPGTFYSHAPGTSSYKVTDLTVTNTTCKVGKKLSSKIPAYRVPKPLHVAGFQCTAIRHYSSSQIPTAGGYESYTCRKKSELVTWKLEVPSEI